MSDELRDAIAKRCAVRRQFDDLGAGPDSYDYAEADELIAAIVAATKKDPRWLEEEGIIEQPRIEKNEVGQHLCLDSGDTEWIVDGWEPQDCVRLYRLHWDPA